MNPRYNEPPTTSEMEAMSSPEDGVAVTAPSLTAAEQAAMDDFAEVVVRDACESTEADPGDERAVCITTDDLRAIIENAAESYVARLRASATTLSDNRAGKLVSEYDELDWSFFHGDPKIASWATRAVSLLAALRAAAPTNKEEG